MMRPAEVVNRVSADEIVASQIGADIVQINDAVRNNGLRVQLDENEVAHSKVRTENRYLAVGDSLFPFDLTRSLQRSRNFVGRIRHPTIRQLRSVEGDVDLRRLVGGARKFFGQAII